MPSPHRRRLLAAVDPRPSSELMHILPRIVRPNKKARRLAGQSGQENIAMHQSSRHPPGDATRPALFQPDAVREALALILPPGQVTELRLLDCMADGDRWPGTWSGYFDDHRPRW